MYQDDTPVLSLGTPQLAVDNPSACGEGPLWRADESAVYWVDIPPGLLYRYDTTTGENRLIYRADGMIGGFTLQTDGSILIFGDRGSIVCLRRDRIETIVAEIDGEQDTRFNDVIAAPDGGVFCGTMASESHLASLYRLAPDGTLTQLFDDIELSNGFGFSPDDTTFYHTDSNAHLIYAMDYDKITGALDNRRVLVRTPIDETVPDGMTVDLEGNLWSARWNGYALYKYGPDGAELGRVVFPVRKISSVAFGGPDYRTAWVTTAGGDQRGDLEGSLAGSLFSIDLGVGGRAPFRSGVGI